MTIMRKVVDVHINAEEARLINALVQRARAVALEYKRRTGRLDLGDIDAYQLFCDFVVAHKARDMRLLQWLMSDATDFQHDMMQIHTHINRVDMAFPDAVPLRFANRGENPAQRHALITGQH